MSHKKTQSKIISVIVILIHLIHQVISEEINCDNNWSESHCYHKKISCNTTPNICSINCIGIGSCDGATLRCNEAATECNIGCVGKQSCQGTATQSTIYCPPNANCNIICGGDYSCDELQIHCPQTSNCTMHANGAYALANSKIYCNGQHNGQCLIHCNNVLSCFDAGFDGRNTSQLTINCANNKNACKNMKVECPQSINGNKTCKINGDLATIHNGIRFYAINSWDDIDLTTFVAKTGSTDNSYESMMSCDYGFDEQCVLSLSAWNCKHNTSVCYRHDINPFPTPVPTHAPTDPSYDEPLQNWAAIIGLIVGVFMFCLFVILGWVWCIKQQRKEKTKYETLDQAPDPDADIMQKETQHMYRSDVPPTKNSKSFDIETKSGLHIVNEYSDASKFGGLLPISEEKTNETLISSNIEEEQKGVTVVNSETDTLISSINIENQNIKHDKARDSNVVT